MYVHLWHVDGERGEVDRELILGPYDGVQLTYKFLRETGEGENVASFDGEWWPLNSENPASYSDVTFSEQRPASLLALADDAVTIEGSTGIVVTLYTASDGAPVVQIDTPADVDDADEIAERIRVYVNDAHATRWAGP